MDPATLAGMVVIGGCWLPALIIYVNFYMF